MSIERPLKSAEILSKSFWALEAVLAQLDGDIPDDEIIWFKIGRENKDLGTYGDIRALEVAPRDLEMKPGNRQEVDRLKAENALLKVRDLDRAASSRGSER